MSAPEIPGDAARALDSLRRIVHALRVATRASERAFGLSGAQLFVLRQLAVTPGQSLTDLARRTRTTQSSVSEVVSALVGRGLIARVSSTQDRRRVHLSLTSTGLAVLDDAPETIQERLLAGFERLDVHARAALAGNLEDWLAASGLGDVAPTLFFEESHQSPGVTPGVTPLESGGSQRPLVP